jgi:hypothetical protein
MKNLLLSIALILFVSLLVSHVINTGHFAATGGDGRSTEGSLAFSVRTVTYYGPYAPRNAGAIWITNAQNQFVKTIKVWASQYRYTLVRWNASSGGNTTGAVTGASLNNHQLHNVTWNGTNVQGTEAPDGEYKINVEFTEHNASAANLGKYIQVSFTKGPDPVNETIPNESYFRDMTLSWTPAIVNGTIFGGVTNGSGNPVSGALIQVGALSVNTGNDGTYSISTPPGVWSVSCSASGYGTQTASNVTVDAGAYVEQNFVLTTVGVSDELSPGARLQLLPVSPNPASSSAKINFYTTQSSESEIRIHNLRGQKVLSARIQGTPGWNEYVWDRRDQAGHTCPAGTYIVEVRNNGQARFRRIQLLP